MDRGQEVEDGGAIDHIGWLEEEGQEGAIPWLLWQNLPERLRGTEETGPRPGGGEMQALGTIQVAGDRFWAKIEREVLYLGNHLLLSAVLQIETQITLDWGENAAYANLFQGTKAPHLSRGMKATGYLRDQATGAVLPYLYFGFCAPCGQWLESLMADLYHQRSHPHFVATRDWLLRNTTFLMGMHDATRSTFLSGDYDSEESPWENRGSTVKTGGLDAVLLVHCAVCGVFVGMVSIYVHYATMAYTCGHCGLGPLYAPCRQLRPGPHPQLPPVHGPRELPDGMLRLGRTPITGVEQRNATPAPWLNGTVQCVTSVETSAQDVTHMHFDSEMSGRDRFTWIHRRRRRGLR